MFNIKIMIRRNPKSIQNRILFFSFFLVLSSVNLHAQQTIGLFANTPDAFDGYTLFAPINNTETYLIDNCGEKVHSWSSNYRPGLSCYLLEDGTLLRAGRIGNLRGIVEMIDWNGNVIWDYSAFATHGKQHHDIELLPNGNILLIVNDERTQSELAGVGGSTNNPNVISEQIIEIQPDIATGGATVVWEWKAWDHLIQDVDSSKPNFGVIANHPERIDINYLDHNNPDWLHINSVDYNEEFDQIILSPRSFSEFWIIDHSTTTSEAAGSTGGNSGKGGDLLYRWGNPQTYDQGTPNDQKLFLQHQPDWLSEPLADAGKILLFNNQAGTLQGQNYSTVNIVDTPVDSNGFYTYNGGAYGPANFDWTYQAPNPTDFYSAFISGAQRFQNGNTLICEGRGGRLFEIDVNENIVWEYVNPVNDLGPMAQNTIPDENNVFRCTRYARDYPGFNGQTLVPQGYIETGSTFNCNLYTSITENTEFADFDVLIYPNPTDANFTIQIEDVFRDDFNSVKVYNLNAKLVYESENFEELIDTHNLSKGIYFVHFDFGNQQVSKKLIIQ